MSYLLPQLQIPRYLSLISENIFSQSEAAVLVNGLNLSVTYPHSNLDMARAVESVVSKLPQILGLKCRLKIGHVREV
jgi:hypothetical protein